MKKRFLRWFLRILVTLVLVLLGGWAFENWRGGRAWMKAKERAALMGVSLDMADYAAGEIAEGERLMEDEVFLAEWNGKIEPELRRINGMGLEGIETPGIRSGSVGRGEAFDYRQYFKKETSEEEAVRKLSDLYEPVAQRLERLGKVVLEKPIQDLGVRTDDFSGSTDMVFRLMKISYAFRECAQLSLRIGESDKAVWACKVVARFGKNYSKPALIDLFLSDAILVSLERVIWDGIRLHEWSEDDLIRLGALFPRDPNYDALEAALRYESSLVSSLVDQAEEMQQKMREIWGEDEDTLKFLDRVEHWANFQGPGGWQDWRKATVLNVNLDTIERRLEWETLGQKEMVVEIDYEAEPEERKRSYHPLSSFRDESIHETSIIAAMQKRATRFRLVAIAIEVERFRLSEGRYPDDLEEVALGFSIQDLTDSEGRDLRYEETANGYFSIWSERVSMEERKSIQLKWLFPEKE